MHHDATRSLRRWIGALSGLLMALALALPATAATEEPDALVKRVSEEVLQILKENQDNPGGAEGPGTGQGKGAGAFRFRAHGRARGGTELAQGNAGAEDRADGPVPHACWCAPTPRRSASSRARRLEFDPQRKSEDQRKAIVRSRLLQPGAEAITVDYKMVAAGSGWKVYDVSVDGVSLVTTYRDAFAEEARANGVDGLIRMLTDKNAALASDKAA